MNALRTRIAPSLYPSVALVLRTSLVGLVVGVLGGCDKPVDQVHKKSCEELAAHLAIVIQEEQGEKVPKEQVEKMIAATTEQCLGSEHQPAAIKCALAATSTKDIASCDKAAAAPADAKKE